MSTRSFPSAFLWGAATSSHQVEGHNENNDWWAWEQEPGRIYDGTRSGAACEWWSGRAEEDLRAAAELGHNAHRLSLEWSRLEPTPGQWNDAAFERYLEILKAARALGLRTNVTVYHFTLPRWAAERGGWLDASLPERFAAFAEECVRRLGPYVDLWATMNEPGVLALTGYAGIHWPPGLGKLTPGYVALGHMLRGHGLAYHAMKRVRPEAIVGIVCNLPFFAPARATSRADRAVSAAQDWAKNGVILQALEHGVLVPPMGGLVPRRVPGLARSFDFFGLNYYGRYAVRFDARQPAMAFGRHLQDHDNRTEWVDWGAPHPAGLTKQLLRLSRLGVPLYVTENGLFDATDQKRPHFLVAHLRAVHDAIAGGADVRGYFHWSLVDNFEWAEGWVPRFGLIALDPQTQERRPRPSAELYARICRHNALPEEH
ncbi:MAG: glycoside hydrolase family 1 protein [Myxococcota bacterium]